jgi:hypothetical protein
VSALDAESGAVEWKTYMIGSAAATRHQFIGYASLGFVGRRDMVVTNC